MCSNPFKEILNTKSPLLKRIKRHITGHIHVFFAATPPGFEELCKYELMRLPINKNGIKTLDGGVEFSGKLHDCYLANLHLRTATRILIRVARFNAPNFRRLEKNLSEIPWELYLMQNSMLKVSVTTRHSRLFHSNAISERVIHCINWRKNVTPFLMDENNNIGLQHIFIRSIEDHLTISLDSSGDLLYKRGIKNHTGKAPIRENLAAAALLKAGYTGEELLLDPMCGTGTFSIEAAMISRHIPPGWYREFSFQSLPGFRPAQWAYIKKQAGRLIRQANDRPIILACDKDLKMCDALSENLFKYDLNNTIRVMHTDFFDLTPADIYANTGLDRPGLIVINPPYGIRIGTRKESRELLMKILNRLVQYYGGWKFAIFSPEKRLFEHSKLKGDQTNIDHGGLKLFLFAGTI